MLGHSFCNHLGLQAGVGFLVTIY